MFIFTIKDKISEKGGNIFTCQTIGEAERQFHDIIANAQEGSLFKSHPEDFTLHLLGEFDDKELKITATTTQEITKGQSSTESLPA